MFSAQLLDPLEAHGIKIRILDELNELDVLKLEDYRGMIAHPGIRNQAKFIEQARKHPNLDIVLFSYGVADYQNKHGRLPIFDISNYKGVIEHFSK
jgi:hypothetical protein